MKKVIEFVKKRYARILTVLLITLLFSASCNYINRSQDFALKTSESCSLLKENREERLKTVCAKISPDRGPCDITVYGVPFDKDSPYYTDIKIVVDDCEKTVFSPPIDEGYTVDIVAMDFLGKGYDQIFYAASSGGSGGFGYYYVFDLSSGKAQILFDFEEFVNVFTAEYADDYTAKVYRSGQPFIAFDLSERKDLKDMWDTNGQFIGDSSPDVSPLNFVEPAYVYASGRYRLNVWQKVTLSCQADVAGYLITTIDLCSDNGFVSILSTHHRAFPLYDGKPVPTPYSELLSRRI